ncbi:MAG: dihydroorotase [Myxococcota bacterium]|jgi:dihydroorotase
MMLTLARPDDWHVHLRDGEMLAAVLPATAAHFGRALVMPNLVPPVTTAAEAAGYRARIAAQSPAGFTPVLAGYLTDTTDPADVAAGFADGVWRAMKLYPANATTNSHHGVTDIAGRMPVFERMAAIGMPLCVHGEVTDPGVDVFDREAVFLADVLAPIRAALPELRIVVEHATTREAVQFVEAHANTWASITPHHLWWNRNALFAGGLRPHAYCLPILKREGDRRALVDAACSGDGRFFAGTDSAPHAVHRKEQDCGCAGVFCAPTALPTYAEVFDDEGALDRLEGFTSHHGADCYGLPRPSATVTLVKEAWVPPETLQAGAQTVRVFRGGETVRWRVRE